MSEGGGRKTTGGRSTTSDKDRRTSDRVNQQRQLQARRHLSADDYGAVRGRVEYEEVFGEDAGEMKSRNQLRRRV